MNLDLYALKTEKWGSIEFFADFQIEISKFGHKKYVLFLIFHLRIRKKS